MSSKLFEYNLTRLIIIGGFFVCALFGVMILKNIYYNNLVTELSASANAMETQYQEQINSEQDPYKLCRLGNIFLQSNQNDLALSAFKKATETDPKYRDGWVWRGYTELKTNQPEEALISLKKAEEIDPIHPRTYELLALVYNQTDDSAAAEKATEKYNYLTKQN